MSCEVQTPTFWWDGTEGLSRRTPWALAGALWADEGSVTVAYVHSGDDQHAREVLASADLQAHGLERVGVEGDRVARTLQALAHARDADLLILGSSRAGISGRVRAGSVGREATDAPSLPIAIAPRGYRARADRPAVVGVVFDASDQVPSCVGEGADLADALGAQVSLACVMPSLERWARDVGEETGFRWSDVTRHHHDQFERVLDEAACALDRPPVRTRLLDGRPVEMLMEQASEGMDLLVASAPPCGTLHGVLVGGRGGTLQSVATPVVVVPCGSARRAGRQAAYAAQPQ